MRPVITDLGVVHGLATLSLSDNLTSISIKTPQRYNKFFKTTPL